MACSRQRCRAFVPAVALHLAVPACLLVDTLDITFPDGERSKTILIAIETEGNVRVFAYPREENVDAGGTPGLGQRIQLPARTSSEIELLMYEETLTELSLGRGEILPSSRSESRPIPPPRMIFGSRVADGALTAWAERTGMSEALAAFRIPPIAPARSECVALAAKSIVIPSSDDAEFAVPLPDGVLVGGGATVVHVTEDEARPLPLDPAGLDLSGGFAEKSGEVWLSAEPRLLYRGTPGAALSLTLFATSSSDSGPRWLDLDRRSDGVEMFSLTRYGEFELWTEGRVQLLYAFPKDHSFSGGVARLGPREAIAVRSGVGGIVVHYRDGAIVEEAVEEGGAGDGFSAAAQVPGLGTIIASSSGHLHRFVDGAWQDLGNSHIAGRILSIAPFRDGFLFGGEFGFVGQYSLSSGFCPLQLVLTRSVFYMARLGDGVLAVRRDSERGVVAAVFLREE